MPRTHLGRDRRSNGVTAGRGPAGEAPPSSGSSIPPARRHRPRDRKLSWTFFWGCFAFDTASGDFTGRREREGDHWGRKSWN